jgi:hypothetical protein
VNWLQCFADGLYPVDKEDLPSSQLIVFGVAVRVWPSPQLLLLIVCEEVFGVDEEHLLLFRLDQVRGSQFFGADGLLFQPGVALKELLHLLDLFVNRIEVFSDLKAGHVLFYVVSALIGHLASDQVHEAAVVVSGCVLLHFWLDVVQTFL